MGPCHLLLNYEKLTDSGRGRHSIQLIVSNCPGITGQFQIHSHTGTVNLMEDKTKVRNVGKKFGCRKVGSDGRKAMEGDISIHNFQKLKFISKIFIQNII